MSNEPKGTDKLQSEIAKEFRNMNSKPGLEIGLRPELGTFELCDKHYDASRTESEEHCAVCQLESKLEKARAKIVGTRDIFHQYLGKTKEVRLLCLKLEKENRQIMAENERYKTVLKSIAAAVKKEEEDTLGWISYAARMAKAALEGVVDE